MALKTLHVSQKMCSFFAFFALIAISQSAVVLSMPDNQSSEESGDPGSESVESGDSVKTLYFVHVVKNATHGAAVNAGGPAKSGADSHSITSRFGGGGIPSASGADSPSITSRFGGGGGIPSASGADSPSITSRFGGGGGIPSATGADAQSITSRFGGGGGIPSASGADSPSITSRFGGGGGGSSSASGADSPSITSRFGGGGGIPSASGNASVPTTETPSTTTKLSRDRSKSPIFNIWEYAKVAGPVQVRTGGHPNDVQQTSTSGLNRCEWAIVSCCQNADHRRRNACFSALHCGGAWFGNPCSDRLQRAVYGRLLEVGPF